MKQNTSSPSRSFGIVLAITAKDILDALKNKNTLTALITILFLIALYKFLPTFSLEDVPFVFLYDSGPSQYTPAIQDSDSLEVRLYETKQVFLERFRRHADAELGLVLPPDFDQTLATGGVPEIQGYVLHWVSSQQVAEQRLDLENRLSAIVDAPVRITMEAGTLTMLPDSVGGFMAAAGMVIILLMIGMVLIPNLMLEEKATRTMDALLVSPANSLQIVLGKAFAGLFYGLLFILLTFVLNGSFVLQWGLALLAILLFTLFGIALGLILGTLIENRQQLIVLTNVIMFPLFLPVFLSLMTDLLPAWLITLMRWLPPVATADLLRISFSELPVPAQSLPRLGLLLAVVLALFAWEAWLLRRSDR